MHRWVYERMNRTSIELREKKKKGLHPALFNYATALCRNLQIFFRPVSIPSKEHSRRERTDEKNVKKYPSNNSANMHISAR
jgi:hypothetical protein